ncbi:class I adenylate-forming enzyme family protein [Microbaculum marinisediminis]|uniref:AMP-binding protein n=1 Tax=Microbaculum marinisediminis TaxID=2931392 RepID=A0AAW5R423_9HYPH|nr:AMP-binding protein [Microbaculum sp. A6E488]MCT8973408.1 AMP-binding protein [Microbaculum sp. A6E488]
MRDISLWIERHASFQPDKPAIRFAGETLSYSGLAGRVDKMAWVLASAFGARRGDRIAWLGFNHPDLLVLMFAAARLGMIVVPLNWRLAAPEHAFILRNAGAKAAIGHKQLLAALSEDDYPDGCRRVAVDGPLDGADTLDDLIAAAGPAPDRSGRAEDPLLLVYTSGTTGRPKGAVLTQSAIAWNAINAIHMHDMTSHDHVLTVLPMFHVGGLNIQTTPALHLGATVTLHEKFDPAAFLKAVDDDRPTLSVLVPATIAAVAGHADWAKTDLSSLRALATGSMIVPDELIAAFHARSVPVIQVYGSSETAPIAIYQRINKAYATVGSMGQVGLHTEVRIVDTADNDLGPGVAGEILVRGPHVASGYWNDPDATAKAFTEGWFRTGDVAEYDENGDYWFRDRIKNVIISGGENIYPAEAERLLREIDGVAECCVVGRPDPRWGAVPVAVIVAADATVSRETIAAHFEGKLARYKHPRDVVFVAELPKNAMGKVRIDEVSRIAAEATNAPA